MTPYRIIRALGGRSIYVVLVLLGALGLLSLAVSGALVEPRALLDLLMSRYGEFLDATVGLGQPYVDAALTSEAARGVVGETPTLSGLWREIFAVFAVFALAIAIPVYRYSGALWGVLNGAVGLAVAAIAAVALDLVGAGDPATPLALAGLLVVFALFRLISGYRRLAALEAGEGPEPGFRHPRAAVIGNGSILAAAALAAAVFAADASSYSTTLAALLWFGG